MINQVGHCRKSSGADNGASYPTDRFFPSSDFDTNCAVAPSDTGELVVAKCLRQSWRRSTASGCAGACRPAQRDAHGPSAERAKHRRLALFSRIHSRANWPVRISVRIFFISARVCSLMIRGPRSVIAELGRVRDAVSHVVEPSLVHQVHNQLQLVQAFKIGTLGLIAGLGQRLERHLHAAHSRRRKARLAPRRGRSPSPRQTSSAARPRACRRSPWHTPAPAPCRPACRFRGRDQAGHASSFDELAADQVPRSLGRDRAAQSTPSGGTTCPKWMLNPWEHSNRSPGRRCGLISRV